MRTTKPYFNTSLGCWEGIDDDFSSPPILCSNCEKHFNRDNITRMESSGNYVCDWCMEEVKAREEDEDNLFI